MIPEPKPIWRRVLGQTGWALAGGIALAVLGVISTILLARWLNPTDMGLVLTVSSAVLLGSSLVQLGLGETAVRDIAAAQATGQSGRIRQMVREIFFLGIMGALLGGVVMGAGGTWFPGGSAVWLPAAGWMVLVSLYGLLTDIGQGIQDNRAMTNPGHLLASGLFAACVAVAMGCGMRGDAQTAIWLRLAASFVSVIMIFFGLRARLAEPEFVDGASHPEPRPLFTWLSRSWPILSHKLIQGFLSQADVLILSAVRPLSEVAIYGVASRLVSLVAFPLSTINVALAPTLAELCAQGQWDRVEKTARQAAATSGLPALAGLVILALAGPLILSKLYGDVYASGTSVILILSAGKLAYVWTGPSGLTLLMSGHQRAMLVVSLIAAVVTMSLGIWWGHVYGGLGMAAAFSTGECIRFLSMLGTVRWKLRIWTHVPIRLDHWWG